MTSSLLTDQNTDAFHDCQSLNSLSLSDISIYLCSIHVSIEKKFWLPIVMKSLDVVHWSCKFVHPIIFIKLYLMSDVCLGLFFYLKL